MKEEFPEHEEHFGHHAHAHSHVEGYTHTHEHSHEAAHEHHGSAAGKAILTVAGVRFEYQADPVLQDITVGVARGEILAILGSNGVGKSTLLKCMNLILKPQAGTILLEERDLTKMSGSEIARNVGYVAQRNESVRMTMHDLNLALRFADRFLFMKEGKIYAACDRSGVTADMIEAVYGIAVDIVMHAGLPMVVPR